MRLTFLKLKEVSELIETDQHQKICDFFNEFEGENIYQKFKTILKFWEYHVSDTLTFGIDNKQLNLQISYLLDELPNDIQHITKFESDELTCELQVSKNFMYNQDEMPVYNLIKTINISGISLNLSDLDIHDRQMIIDKLPAKIFSNLIDNAIKYAKDTIDITIKTSTLGNKIQIAFQDKGIGMDSDTAKHIFEKFYRAHSGNIHNVKGFGLGMSYVKWVMDIHKGTIKVDSALGKGTTITLLLPIEN